MIQEQMKSGSNTKKRSRADFESSNNQMRDDQMDVDETE